VEAILASHDVRLGWERGVMAWRAGDLQASYTDRVIDARVLRELRRLARPCSISTEPQIIQRHRVCHIHAYHGGRVAYFGLL